MTPEDRYPRAWRVGYGIGLIVVWAVLIAVSWLIVAASVEVAARLIEAVI